MANFELPKFESTLKNDGPAAPNFSVQNAPNIDTGPANVALQRQAQQNQMNQQGLDNILKTTKMASDLAQSFVEASKQRQQRDAVAAYAALQPNKTLAGVMKAFPEETAKAAVEANYPKTFQGLAVNSLNQGQPVNPELASTAQSLMHPVKPQPVKLLTGLGDDGKPHNFRIDPATNQLTDLGLAVPKPVGGAGGSDDKLANTITNDVNKDPLYTKANQKATDIQGARDGIKQAIADPSTGVTALAGMEAVKSIVSQRFTQQEWEKTLPDTGVKSYASAMEWLTNNPQDPRATAFLQKLDGFMQVEQATQNNAKQARASQILKSKDSLLKSRPDLAKNLYSSMGVSHPTYNPTNIDAVKASVRQKLGL